MSNQPENDNQSLHMAIGAELRTAREKRDLSLHQVSQELHTGDWIIDALERGDYTSIGAPIFVRGHLRGYARLLGLNEDEILAQYEKENDKPAPPPLVTQKLDSGINRASPWIFTIVVGVILCVLAVTWWTRREQPAQETAANTNTPVAGVGNTPIQAPVNNGPEETALPPAPDTPGKPDIAAMQQPAEQVKPKNEAGPQLHATKHVELPPANAVQSEARVAQKSQPTKAPQSGSVGQALTHVEFTLEQASWIEVYDAAGKRLYYDLAPAGENVNVSGAGPLQVFLGNAPGVDIKLDGTKFDQGPYTRADNTARFRLGRNQGSSGQTG